MKKLLFLLLAILTCYLAGVYRYPALMLLFVIEAVFLVISCFLTFYFRKHLKLAFLRHSEVMEKGIPLDCGIVAENKGRLPISRFRVKLRYGYGENQKNTKRLYGGMEGGKAELHFQIAAQYCGRIQLTIASFSVYDYLALFSKTGKGDNSGNRNNSRKRGDSEKGDNSVEIAVFPPQRALQIEFASLLRQESPLPQEQQPGWGEDAHNEIRQLREYRTGDSNRHIHWNQSAKMDSIWIKEFEKETDRRPELLLDLEGIENATRQKLDAFYELLSAIVQALSLQEGMVRVSWYCAEKKAVEHADITDTAQCRDMLLRLYRSEPSMQQWRQKDAARDGRPAEGEASWGQLMAAEASLGQLVQGANRENLMPTQGDYFKLDLALNWYQNETLIFRFSQKSEVLAEQIEQKVFIL